ncbi:hypothetical protein [Stagnimonas aquatica]|uniref:hypothetical protein n=1 Tax=Stagnimonas aquatica TaxID=2689987 RepID=UPI0011CD9C18|nr:hypothetical protein [Stagnimonas aquatica]
MSEIDLFELREPKNLFAEIQEAMAEYCREPSSRLLLFLLFSLNHLREWIAGAGYEALKAKRQSGQVLLPAEMFYFELWTLEEFQTINALCNRSKHASIRSGGATSVSSGATCNSWCCDSLDQTYYRIDGIDSREIFFPVIQKYHAWFASNG